MQISRSQQDDVIVRLVQDVIEILVNFQLIVTHFGEAIIDMVSNTNFMVNLTNAYCLLRKMRKFWLEGFATEAARKKCAGCIGTAIALTVDITATVLQKGIILRINAHTKNYAVVQNKLAQTIKSYIESVTGNLELSREVMHKQTNFMCAQETHGDAKSLYSGRNYSINLVRQITKKGISLKDGIMVMDERFLSESDGDFLLMIVESMHKGERVQIARVKPKMPVIEEKDGDSKLSTQDRANITQIHDMFGGQHTKQFIEGVYKSAGKCMEVTLEMFLTNNLPKKEDELHVIIEQKHEKKTQRIDTTHDQI